MKKTLTTLAAGALLAAGAAAAPEIQTDSDGKLQISLAKTNLLIRDTLTLQTKEWKVAASAMDNNFTVETIKDETVCRWKNAAGEFQRRHRVANNKAVIVWEGEFVPGIADGRYIELALLGPRNSYKTLPPSPAQTVAEGNRIMELKSDAGTLLLDPAGSSRAWKLQDMRLVSWAGFMRMLFFDDYQPAKGRKFKAVLTISSAAEAVPTGDGGEYANIVLAPEIREAPGVLPAVLTVNAQSLRESTPRLFGVNNDWHGYENLKLAAATGPATALNPVDPEFFTLFAQVPLPLTRTAGTDSQYIDFKKMTGPNRERQPVIFGPNGKGYTVGYGPLEHFSAFRKLDPGTEFVYVVRLYKTTPAESRELAEFFTAGPETEWGAKRIARGVKEPVLPAIWELGNEMDLGGPKHMEVDEYVAACKAHIAAIRSVVPNARFAAHAISSPWDPSRAANWQGWHRKVLAELAPDLAYMVFHPYYRGLPPGQMLRYLDAIRDDIKASANPGIAIFNSEHAKWPPGYNDGPEAWRKNWFQTHALIGVLDTAEWQLLMLNRPDVGAQTYHALSAGPWGLVYRDEKGLYTTGIAELFRFLEDAHQGTVLNSTLAGIGTDPYREPFHFSSAAIRSNDGKQLTVYLNNRLPRSHRTLEIKIGGWKLASMTALTAPSLESVNTRDRKSFVYKILPMEENDGKAVIPPQSLVKLTFHQISGR